MLFPFIPVAMFIPRKWRFFADRMLGYWLTFPASLIEFVFGSRFHVTGDLIKRDKPAIILMNHRTRLDWLFLWNALYKMDPWLLTTEKISLKAPLKRIPGAGWAMGCGLFIFLERSFETDKENMRKIIEYYSQSGCSFQLLLFAEGTDRGARAAALSDAFAEKNKLPKYDYVLHPRTTGFSYLVDLMEKNNYLDNIYDVTVAYEDVIVESEMQLLKEGVFPKNVHFDVKRYEMEDLPSDMNDRVTWLNDIWKVKEARLKKFYTAASEKKGLEPSGDRYVWPVETRGLGYYVTFAFWILSSCFWIHLIVTSTIVQIYVVIAVMFYCYALRYHNGVEFLILKWFAESQC